MSVVQLGVALSISKLAEECGTTRERVSKRLNACGVQPCGKRNGYPVYRLRDALPAIFSIDETGKANPDTMNQFERHAFYRAERLAREQAVDAGELIPAAEVEAELYRVTKIFTQCIETLPDVLERDCGLPADQVTRIEKHCDQYRDRVHAELVAQEVVGEGPPSRRVAELKPRQHAAKPPCEAKV